MNKARIVTILIVAAAAVGFFVWLTGSYVLESQAGEDLVDIQILPVDGQAPDEVTFIVQPKDENHKVSGVDLYVGLENGTIDSWGDCQTLDESSDAQFTSLVTETGKSARNGCVVFDKSDKLPRNILLTAKVSCTSSGPMRMWIDKDNTQVTGPVEDAQYSGGVFDQVTFSCDGSTPIDPTADIKATFEPDSCTGEVGDSCDYTLKIESQNEPKKISGVYVKLGFDSNVMQLDNFSNRQTVLGTQTLAQTVSCTSNADCLAACPTNNCQAKCNIPAGAVSGTCVFATVTPATGSAASPTPTPGSNVVSPTVVPPVTGAPTAPVPTDPVSTPSATPDPSTSPEPSPTPGGEKTDAGCEIVSSDLQDGSLEMLLTCDGAEEDLGISISQALSFSAIANGYGQLTIDSIQVVGPNSSSPYSVTTGRASYNIGAGSGNVSLNLELRLQCVVKKPKRDVPVDVRVGLGDGSLQNTVYKTGSFTFNDKGHLVGSVTFDAPAGAGYKVLPKYSMGMQKKVCEASPTEDYPGAYSCDKGNITLQDGSNDLDLSNIVLLTGDLPPGEQDGISNAFDQNLIRQLIGKRDEESAALADVNFDGVVNAIDHSCMVAALAVRWDEE